MPNKSPPLIHSTNPIMVTKLAAGLAAVKAHAEALRALGISWRLTCTSKDDAVVGVYDTLLVRQQIHANTSPSDIAPAIRNALSAWHETSKQPGMSFKQNVSFWMDALDMRPEIRVYAGSPRVTRAFPGVIFFFGYTTTLAPFIGATSPFGGARELPSDGNEAVDDNSRIQCVIRFQLGQKAAKTKELVDYLLEQLPQILQNWRLSRFQLTGAECVGRNDRRHCGLEVNHMAALQELSAKLPRELTLAVRFPYSVVHRDRATSFTHVDARVCAAFVQRMVGFHGSTLTGRLQVLDLVGAFASKRRVTELRFHFASLCTLLPFSTTLRELRVRIPSQNDLLWLAYAIFHPRSVTTSWKTLVVDSISSCSPALDWQAVERLVYSTSPRLKTLMQILVEDYDSDQEVSSNDDSGHIIDLDQPVLHTVVTASATKRTTVFALDRSTRLVSLSTGDRLELCDTSVDLSTSVSEDTTDVAVVVPGYGLGYIRKSHLALVERTEITAKPTSCITSLHWGPSANCNKQAALRVLGPSLRHLHVSSASWFEYQGFSDLAPNLETVDWCSFSRETSAEDFHALPKLRALSVVCYETNIDRCFQQLLTPNFQTLSELRLQLQLSLPSLAAVKAHMRPLFCRLRHCKISLLATKYDERKFHQWHEDDAVPLSGLCVGRLAFLSAVHHAQSQAQGPGNDALAQLDCHLIQIVFEFYGIYRDSFEVVHDQASFGYPRHPNDTDDPDNAWFT